MLRPVAVDLDLARAPPARSSAASTAAWGSSKTAMTPSPRRLTISPPSLEERALDRRRRPRAAARAPPRRRPRSAQAEKPTRSVKTIVTSRSPRPRPGGLGERLPDLERAHARTRAARSGRSGSIADDAARDHRRRRLARRSRAGRRSARRRARACATVRLRTSTAGCESTRTAASRSRSRRARGRRPRGLPAAFGSSAIAPAA